MVYTHWYIWVGKCPGLGILKITFKLSQLYPLVNIQKTIENGH